MLRSPVPLPVIPAQPGPTPVHAVTRNC
jgi:hypothetical protein